MEECGEKDGATANNQRTSYEKEPASDYRCHCEPRSGVAISSTMYPLEMH
jgi:hypothetical protein